MAKWNKTVFESGTGELIEKKSRFIATIRRITSEEEAVAFLEKTRKQYWDARHNCYAYILGSNQQVVRSSDDGEPQGTAGHPILDVLMGAQVYDAIIVVTRYFGGVLLGTGGLVRAYSGAAKEALEAAQIITRKTGKRVEITTDYNGVGKLQYLTATGKITVLDTRYTDVVTTTVLLEPDQMGKFHSQVMDLSAGRAGWEEGEDTEFAETQYGILTGEDLNGEE